MATVLDAQALVALFRNEPAAEAVERILRQGNAVISAFNLAEAIDQLHRIDDVPMVELQEVVATVVPTTLEVVDVTVRHAMDAARIRARHYHRTRSSLSLADCLVVALSDPKTDRVATADGPVLRAAQAEGREIIILPDSRGKFASVTT